MQPPQEHATCYAARVDFCTRKNITMKRTTAMSATSMGVMQKAVFGSYKGGEKNTCTQVTGKMVMFQAEQHTEKAHRLP